MKRRIKCALAAAAAAAALCSAAPAAADSTPEQDAAFADALNDVGLTPGPEWAAAVGNICVRYIFFGAIPSELASEVYYVEGDISYTQASQFVAAAIYIYCPPGTSLA